MSYGVNDAVSVYANGKSYLRITYLETTL